jgi:hypothetical protein
MVKYSPSIVTFVDVLGFSDLVAKRTAADVADILSRFASHNAPSRLSDQETISYFAFSDTVVRIVPMSDAQDEDAVCDALLTEVSDIAAAQILLSQRGVFVRGAIASGDAYAKNGQMFGPGVIKSYELENKRAQYPRVVVEAELVRVSGLAGILEDTDPDYSEYSLALGELEGLCRRDRDGLVFVDYLAGMCRIGDDGTAEAQSERHLLERNHRDAVRAGLEACDSGTLGKYLWLRDYHNLCVGGATSVRAC